MAPESASLTAVAWRVLEGDCPHLGRSNHCTGESFVRISKVTLPFFAFHTQLNTCILTLEENEVNTYLS